MAAAGVFLPSDWSHEDRVLGTMMESAYTGASPLVEWPIGSSATAEPSRVLLDAPMKQFWQGRYSPDARWVSFVVVTLGPAGESPSSSWGSHRRAANGRRPGRRAAADHAPAGQAALVARRQDPLLPLPGPGRRLQPVGRACRPDRSALRWERPFK